jgi:hypothetical protein
MEFLEITRPTCVEEITKRLAVKCHAALEMPYIMSPIF